MHELPRPMEANDFVYTMPMHDPGAPLEAFNATAALPASLPDIRCNGASSPPWSTKARDDVDALRQRRRRQPRAQIAADALPARRRARAGDMGRSRKTSTGSADAFPASRAAGRVRHHLSALRTVFPGNRTRSIKAPNCKKRPASTLLLSSRSSTRSPVSRPAAMP